MSDAKSLILKRKDVKFEVNTEFWAEVLLLSIKYGWKPDKLSMEYLAHPLTISEGEAEGIYLGLENLFKKTLEDPVQVYPLRINMGDLYELKGFIQQGGFSTEYV